jgi:4-hydroxy-4-methyl-2-oxoglutarate aldolase
VENNMSLKEIKELKAFSTPTISNAIELFQVKRRNEGFLSAGIKCIFPKEGVLLGYAATAVISACQPKPNFEEVSMSEYWKYIADLTEPKVIVIQDIDEPACIGSFWGEVNASIHKSLGCAGVVTNGSVRDLDEMKIIHFQTFASAVSVSHAYAHLEAFNVPIEISDENIGTNDFIHADKHGVIIIPDTVLPYIAEAARELEDSEKKLIEFCRSPSWSQKEMWKQYSQHCIRLGKLTAKYTHIHRRTI